MKKITFYVCPKENFSLDVWFEDVKKISCQSHIEPSNNGIVEFYNVNDDMIDSVVDLVSSYFTISSTEIDNKEDEISPEDQKIAEMIAKKVEFENKYIEEKVNKFLRTAYAVLVRGMASQEDIGWFITTATTNLYFSYLSNETVEVKVGDVVDCNMGYNVRGEVNGGHISCIVCRIVDDKIVYVVPIAKCTGNEIKGNCSFLELDVGSVIIYDNRNYDVGTVLISKGREIRIERIINVIGKTSSDFFEKVLLKLATTFAFTDYIDENAMSDVYEENYIDSASQTIIWLEEPEIVKHSEENCTEIGERPEEHTKVVEDAEEQVEETAEVVEIAEELLEEIAEVVETAEETVEEINKEDQITDSDDEYITLPVSNKKATIESFKPIKTKSTSKKAGIEETTLKRYIGSYLDEIDKTNFEKSVKAFLSGIGMSQDILTVHAFWAACNIDKINYIQITSLLHELHPDIDTDEIEATLKEEFGKWLENYPDLKNECSRISLITLLKAFARRFE